jgi:hypothetical protein
MEKLPSGTVTFLFTDRPSYGLVKLNPPPALTAPRIGPTASKDAAAKLLSLFTAARRKATYRLVRHSFREQVRRLSCKPHEGASRERFVADHAEHASCDCFRRDKLRHRRPIFRAHLRE